MIKNKNKAASVGSEPFYKFPLWYAIPLNTCTIFIYVDINYVVALIIYQKQFKFIKTDILYTKQGNKQWEKYQHSNSRGSTTLFLINITEEYITLPELRARNQGCPLCALVSHG